jgi:hypothetical protein
MNSENGIMTNDDSRQIMKRINIGEKAWQHSRQNKDKLK